MALKKSIPSTVAAISDIYEWLKEQLSTTEDEHRTGIILLVVQEIVTNAVIHGNKEDPDKTVAVEAELDDPSQIIVRVTDEGDGIPPLPSADEAEQMDYLDENGRGMKLAVKLSDAITCQDTTLSVVFKRHEQRNQ